jgi:hypothetical protein
MTIKAFATDAGRANSKLTTNTYVISVPAATPAFSPAAGHYTTPETLTLSDATTGANIYLTLDGTTPTTSSIRYTGPIRITKSVTIKAFAVAPGYQDSPVAAASYTIP